jgi:probable F420-dependent oxidoreductase
LTPRPFRFGLSANRPRSKPQWKSFAQTVERLGYHTLVMPDHFGARLSPAPALVLAAEATERLRVGSFVYDNDFRHPALLAQEVATIDILTGGRFDFGIGAGWLKSEYDAAGLPFDPGGVRVERLAEAVALIKQLLAGEPATFAGKHYQVTNLTAGFKSVQRPHPPVLIGGGGRRLLMLAAHEADIISVMPRSRRDGSGLEDADAGELAFQQKIGWVRDAAGSRFDSLELNTLVQAVLTTDDPNTAAAKLAAEWQMPAHELLRSPLLLIGSVDQIAETLHMRRDQLGLSSITVFEKDMERLAPVIERLQV